MNCTQNRNTFSSEIGRNLKMMCTGSRKCIGSIVGNQGCLYFLCEDEGTGKMWVVCGEDHHHLV